MKTCILIWILFALAVTSSYADIVTSLKGSDYHAIFKQRDELFQQSDRIKKELGDNGGHIYDFSYNFLKDLPKQDAGIYEPFAYNTILDLIAGVLAGEGAYVDVMPNAYYEAKLGYCNLILNCYRSDGTGTRFWVVAKKTKKFWQILRIEYVLTWG